MLIPPFCPYSECANHTALPITGRWYHLAGSYHTTVSGTVTRFICLGCGRTFSEQTFRLDYFVKRKLSYRRIFTYMTNCGGIRATARVLGVSHQAISNRLGRLARQSMALQADLLSAFTPKESLVTDGFESFVKDQYQPNNIHLLVGKNSQFLFAYDYAHLRRKGRMTDEQKEERSRREQHYIRERRTISQSFKQIADMVEQFALRRYSALNGGGRKRLCLHSDEKFEYQEVLKQSPILQELRRREMFFHLTTSSRLVRSVRNPLFAVNYFDREIRKDNADHVRQTVRFSRNVNSALERLAVYQLYHNFFKPYRVGDIELRECSHADRAGIGEARLETGLENIFSIRKFFSHVRLNWSQMLVWARMVGTLDKNDGVFWPKYVWM